MRLLTNTGNTLSEVISTLQKAIRRGDENNALYFAAELFTSGFDEYAWKRLRIITSEDIGLAEPNMPAVIQSLYQSYTQQKAEKKENKPERLFYVHAILLLVRAKKSRLVDYAAIKIWRDQIEEPKRAVPDYAYDMHTAKGRGLKRGIDHFYEDGSKLENYEAQPGEEELKAAALEIHKRHPARLKFEEKKIKQDLTLFDE